MAHDEDAQPYVLPWSMENQHVPLRRCARPIFASMGCIDYRHIGVRHRTRFCCLHYMAGAKSLLFPTSISLLALLLLEEVNKNYYLHCD
jgi:hypothetical protein